MSVRAYRINKIDREECESFNLWNDGELIDFFEDNGTTIEERMDERGGQFEISLEVLEKAIKEYPWEPDDYRIEAFKADVAFAKMKGMEYLLYDCF